MKKIILLLFLSLIIAQTKGPSIFVKKTFHNHGDMKEGDFVTFEYVIENKGDDLLIINDVRSSCGCTAVEPEKRRLLPGEKTIVKAEFNSINRQGPQTKYVYLFTNDPNVPQTKLSFSANVIPKSEDEKANEEIPMIRIDKNFINLGTVKKNSKHTSELAITNLGKKELVIKDIKSSCDCLNAEITNKRLKAKEKAKLKLFFDTKGLTGKVSRTIVLITNDPYNIYYNITMFVTIEE